MLTRRPYRPAISTLKVLKPRSSLHLGQAIKPRPEKVCGIYTMASPTNPSQKVVNVSSGPDTEKSGHPVFVLVSLDAWIVSKNLLETMLQQYSPDGSGTRLRKKVMPISPKKHSVTFMNMSGAHLLPPVISYPTSPSLFRLERRGIFS